MGTSITPESTFLRRAIIGLEPKTEAALRHAALDVNDWSRVVVQCERHGLGPWLLATLGANPDIAVPEGPLQRLRQQVLGCSMQQLVLVKALEQLLTEFAGEDIEAIVLKGQHVAERLYSSAGLRPYRDLDVLVHLADERQVDGVCKDLGYIRHEGHGPAMDPRPGTAEAPFERLYIHKTSGVRLDLHFDHLQLGLRPTDLDGFWRRAKPWRFLAATALVPRDNDLMLALAVHLHRHGFARSIWLKDIDLLVRQGDIDWRSLHDAALQEGAAMSVQECLVRTHRYLDTPLPDGALHAAERPGILHRLLWREQDFLSPELRGMRWRRAVQYVPMDGLRGALPSLVVMGRRWEKLKALRSRLFSPNLPPSGR